MGLASGVRASPVWQHPYGAIVVGSLRAVKRRLTGARNVPEPLVERTGIHVEYPPNAPNGRLNG